MSPKERVRGNIYKDLFTNEKKKNKKMAFASLSLFVVGLFSGSTYQSLKEMNNTSEPNAVMAVMALMPSRSKNSLSIKSKFNSDLLEDLPKITLDGNRDFSRSINEITEQNITIDHILNDNVFEAPKKEINTVNTDKLFGLDDVQI